MAEHGMLPGSHERRSGPECRCGAEWSYWDDACTTTLGGSDEVIHLFPGHDNGDGTVTVTSFISLCCKTALPSGRATIAPEHATCPRLAAALGVPAVPGGEK